MGKTMTYDVIAVDLSDCDLDDQAERLSEAIRVRLDYWLNKDLTEPRALWAKVFAITPSRAAWTTYGDSLRDYHHSEGGVLVTFEVEKNPTGGRKHREP